MQPFDSIDKLTLPPEVECRTRELKRRQSEGRLSASERNELELLIEAQATLAIIRAKAKKLSDATSAAANGPVQTIRNGLPVMLVPPGTPPIDPAAVRRCLEEQGFDFSARRKCAAQPGVGQPSSPQCGPYLVHA
jgi:hypothetical protein